MDFRLIPLLKGLKIGQITSQLIESHDLTLNPEDPDTIRNTYKTTRTIVTDNYELDEENQLEIIAEAAEGYQFCRYLDMPKTLTKCLQDADTKGIKIRHKLKFRVQLHNPDGHTSEVSKDQARHSAQLLMLVPSYVLRCPFRSSSLRTFPSTRTITLSIRTPRLPGEHWRILHSKLPHSTASITSTNCTASSTLAVTGLLETEADQARPLAL